MLSVEEARKSYGDVVAKIKTAEGEFRALTGKLDAMEAQTSALKSKIESSENEERSVYDSYFLGKASDKDLTDIRRKLQTAKDALSTHSKMLESLNRCIAGKESEVTALRKQVDSLRHQVWNSLFEQRAAEIPESVRATVNELVTIGLQCSMGLNFILPKIFPLPTNSEIQKICKEQTEKHGITD